MTLRNQTEIPLLKEKKKNPRVLKRKKPVSSSSNEDWKENVAEGSPSASETDGMLACVGAFFILNLPHWPKVSFDVKESQLAAASLL